MITEIIKFEAALVDLEMNDTLWEYRPRNHWNKVKLTAKGQETMTELMRSCAEHQGQTVQASEATEMSPFDLSNTLAYVRQVLQA